MENKIYSTEEEILQNELVTLNAELNSRCNAYGHIKPPLERQKIIFDRINEINEELFHIVSVRRNNLKNK